MSTHVKICGVTRVADALKAVNLGAYALGLNFCAESARHVDIARAREIHAALPQHARVAGVFVNPSASRVRGVLRELSLSFLQFHGDESAEFCADFGVPYVKALRVRPGMDLLQYAARYADAHALLMDGFVAERYGGTGHAFDWRLIPRNMPLPIILSGGLNASNVKAAIETVRPWAVDVASGIESSPGIKDAEKMAAFMREVSDVRPA
ncbi:MAG: phosphoribosylanthranilate isomerase [Burkholderiales bacterium]